MAIKKRAIQALWLGDPPPQLVLPGGGSAGYDIEIAEEEKAASIHPSTDKVGLVESADVAFTPGDDGTRYTAYIRARTAAGYLSVPAEAAIPLVAYDGGLEARPSRTTNVRVKQLADGDVEVKWSHRQEAGSVAPASFKVYADRDWGTVKATATGVFQRKTTVSGLTADEATILTVRAVSADLGGGRYSYCGNTVARRIVPRDTPPGGLSAGELVATLV